MVKRAQTNPIRRPLEVRAQLAQIRARLENEDAVLAELRGVVGDEGDPSTIPAEVVRTIEDACPPPPSAPPRLRAAHFVRA